MSKVLTVATAAQKAVFEQVLLQEIATGFWKEARPADHADNWKGVSVQVGTKLGPEGFEIPRTYNFVNPDFFKKAAEKLLEAAKTVEPEMTEKLLKKQLIQLNQIVGQRLTEVGKVATKLPRGRQKTEETETKSANATTTTRKAAAVFADPVKEDEGTDNAISTEAEVIEPVAELEPA